MLANLEFSQLLIIFAILFFVVIILILKERRHIESAFNGLKSLKDKIFKKSQEEHPSFSIERRVRLFGINIEFRENLRISPEEDLFEYLTFFIDFYKKSSAEFLEVVVSLKTIKDINSRAEKHIISLIDYIINKNGVDLKIGFPKSDKFQTIKDVCDLKIKSGKAAGKEFSIEFF